MPLIKDRTFGFFALERTREVTELPVSANAFNQLTVAKPLGAVPTNNIPTPFDEQRYNGRWDHRFSPTHGLSMSYTSQSSSNLNDLATSSNDLTGGNFTTNRMILASASLNSVVSPAIVNSVTAGYQYWNNVIDSNNEVPRVSFPSAAFGTNPSVPQQSAQAKWQFRDDLSINRGRHSFKTGFDYVHEPKLRGVGSSKSLNVTFQDDPSTILGNATRYPNGFSTPGAITAMSASTGNSSFNIASAKMLGVYFQDDWKMARRLNINLGVRWDRDFNLHGGKTQGLNRTYQALKAVGSSYASSLPKDDMKDFSPRFGVAYDLLGSGKHVIRGGYGIYFDQIFVNITLFSVQQENDTVFTQVMSLTSTGPGDPNASMVPGVGKPLSQYRYGVDPLPAIPAPSSSLPPGSVGHLVNPNSHNPYNQEWNLGYTWQATANDVIEVEGIHSLALRENKRQNLNWIDFRTGTRVYDAAFAAAGLPRLAQIRMQSFDGRSRYDALNVAYRRRMSRRFSINTNYVRSRALAYAGYAANSNNGATDPTNRFWASDFGYSPSDEKHRWLFSGIYQAKWGIELATITQWASGRPLNITEGVDVYGFGADNGAWRAVVPTTDPRNYTFTKAFTAAQLRAGLANGSLTTVSYDSVRGGRFFQLDMRVSKSFRIREDHKIAAMVNFYDLTNHSNFGTNYGTSIRSATFLQPTGFFSTSGVIIPHAFSAEIGFRYSF